MNLYELTTNYQNLLNFISDGNEGFEDTLESLNDAIEVKVENIAKVVKSLEAEVTGYKTEEKRLSDRRKSIENNIKRLKTYTEESMLSVGMKRIKGQLFTVAIQKNAPSLFVEEETHIPEGYYIPQEPKLNRKELLEDLKNGDEIMGVEVRQTESLRIR